MSVHNRTASRFFYGTLDDDEDDSLRCESPRSVRDGPQQSGRSPRRGAVLQKKIAQYKASLLPLTPPASSSGGGSSQNAAGGDVVHAPQHSKYEKKSNSSSPSSRSRSFSSSSSVASVASSSSSVASNSWAIKNRFRKVLKGRTTIGSSSSVGGGGSFSRRGGKRSSTFDWSMDFRNGGKQNANKQEDDLANYGDDDALSEFCDSSTTSSCNTPDTPDDSDRKRVRFQLKSNGKGDKMNAGGSCLKLTEDEVESLWWTRKERRDMKRRTQTLANSFVSAKTDYRSAVEQLLLKCVDENGQKTHYAEPRQDRTDPFSYEQALRIAVHHEARGLEQGMVNSLNLQSCRFYYRCGSKSVETVLKAQAALRELQGVSADSQSTLIAMNLRQCSGFAVQFAQMLADGDAKVANGEYDSDDSSTSSLDSSLSSCSSSDGLVNAADEEVGDENDRFLLNELCQL